VQVRHTVRTRALLGLCVSLGLLVVPVAASIGVSAAPAAADKLTRPPGTPMFDVGVRHGNGASNAAAAAAPKLKTFGASVVDNGVTYHYRMVGKNPAIAVLKPSTTITTILVPLDIKFPVGEWDPTVIDTCDAGASSLTRTQNSPIFKSHAYTWGGTPIGTGQYVNEYQRANFWSYANPTGINPGYNVKLKLVTLAKVVVNVPAADSFKYSAPCGNGFLGAMEINWFDNYLESTLIPSLASSGVAPNTFPIFLVHNVVEYIGTPGNCCVLGYHNATSGSPSAQTYAVSMYDNSSDFTGISDVMALSHEVGEWMDDPFTNNLTRPWGHIGQVGGCQNNLENGDPLTGTEIPVTMGGFTYHPQELVFFSWFFRQHPSLGVNGWYSNNGTFTTTQGTCV
jgi:hypothetical protein